MDGFGSDSDSDMLLLDSPTYPSLSQESKLSAASETVVDFIDRTFDHVNAELSKRASENVYVELEKVASTYKRRNSRSKARQRKVKYHWPGDTPEEAWRFTCVLAVLLEVRKAITSGAVVTKRDIYYRQPELFKSQITVDKWIDDIALTCRVSRRDLMVTASQKGLICGLSNTERVQSIGQDFQQIRMDDIDHLRWVLVIEKEASFNTLVEVGLDQSRILGPGLLVTGKGYPDLQTRFFLRHILNTVRHPIKLFGIFDGDPDGLEIYRCFQYGSQALAHETASLLPEIRWLGVDICECLSNPEILKHAVPLTPRDCRKACSMLTRLLDQEDEDQENKISRMLRTMLMLGVKLEIQGFGKITGGLKSWLEVSMTP